MTTNSGKTGKFDDELRISEHFPRRNYEDWEEEARLSLRGQPLESLTVATHEGIPVKPLYTTEDLPLTPLQIPEKSSRSWSTCCPVDLRRPEKAVLEAARGLAQGADSLWLKVDRRISGWGRLNIGILARLLEISREAPIYLDGRGATPALAAVVAAASQRTGKASNFHGGFDFDPLGTLAAQETWDRLEAPTNERQTLRFLANAGRRGVISGTSSDATVFGVDCLDELISWGEPGQGHGKVRLLSLAMLVVLHCDVFNPFAEKRD